MVLALAGSTVAEEQPASLFELPPARGAVDLSSLEAFSAPEADPSSFQLQAEHEQHPAVRAEAGSPVLDKDLGVVGLPGMAGASSDESTYEKAWRMSDSPNGGTRLTYGERYRRNPDGSYGAQSSSQWSGVNNVADRLLEQALSAGSGYFSSWAEGWLGGFGKARISVRVNDEGDVTGSGDFLYPIYDSERTTFFTQIGLRTMANDRVIGNFGLGQRFFPAENFALGYNVFLDQDFSRNHTRGGAGIEAWYDWLRLSANYYTPLSGWKDSEDYDSRLVEERPAEGYDARLTGYLPFYRNLAVTGAFEQWKGDHVGSFGSDDVVQKDPEIWSYGLEWTPVPAFAASVNQRHSGGQKETQFGLTFNYHFGMDWEDQLSPAMVTEMRTVGGSRHDFVNRQNEMILAYRAKDGAYNIVQRGTGGLNIFMFQITNGFGEPVAGQIVTVSLPAGVTDSGGGVYTADANGLISLELTAVPASAVPTVVTLTAGKTSKTFTLGATATRTLVFTTVNGGKFVEPGDHGYGAGTIGYQSTASATVTQYDDGSGAQTLPGGARVVWSVKSAGTPSGGLWKRSDGGTKNGLTWGTDADETSSWAADAVENEAAKSTTNTVQITDVVGSRSVTLEASVCIGGSGLETTESACTGNGGGWYTGETTVSFDAGPLSVFSGTIEKAKVWSTEASLNGFTSADGTNGNIFRAPVGTCSGTVFNGSAYIDNVTGAITEDGTYWQSGDDGGSYSPHTNLPELSQLLAIAGYSSHNAGVPRKGAASAAGWSTGTSHYALTGEVRYISGSFQAKVVTLANGQDFWEIVSNANSAAVCLRH